MKKKIILAVLVSVVGVVSVIAIRIRQVEAQRKAEMEEIAREMREAVKDSQYLGMTEEEVIAKFGAPHKLTAHTTKWASTGIFGRRWRGS